MAGKVVSRRGTMLGNAAIAAPWRQASRRSRWRGPQPAPRRPTVRRTSWWSRRARTPPRRCQSTSARRIAGYQAFDLVEASGADAARLRAGGAVVRDDMREVRIGDESLDPTTGGPQLAGGKGAAGRSPGRGCWSSSSPVRSRTPGGRACATPARGSSPTWPRTPTSSMPRRPSGARRGAARRPGGPCGRPVPRRGEAPRRPAGVRHAGRGRPDAHRRRRRRRPRRGRAARERARRGHVRRRVPDAADAGRRRRGSTSWPPTPRVLNIEPFVDAGAPRRARGADRRRQPQRRVRADRPGYLAYLAAEGFPATIPTSSSTSPTRGSTPASSRRPARAPSTRTSSPAAARRADADRVHQRPHQRAPPNAGRDCGGHGTNVASIATGLQRRDGRDNEDAAGFNYGLGVAPRMRVGASKIFNCAGQFPSRAASAR